MTGPVCDCQYESPDAPGVEVLPVIVRGETLNGGHSPRLSSFLLGKPYMRPGGLYQCRLCREYVYITLDAQARPMPGLGPAAEAS